MRSARTLLALAALALLASSCAFYNTFYLARKNYLKGTDGTPYVVDKAAPVQAQYFNKAVEYSKKLLASYPRSKWVDDAYLMWAKSLLAQNDPLQTVNMLQGFTSRYPDSPLRNEATFYLGVGYRQARKYNDALRSLDEFLAAAPRHDLAPYAHMERARVLMALERPGDAADAAGVVLTRFPKSLLAVEARKARAEALYKRGDFAGARADFRFLNERSLTEDERLGWLLREADCLEGARDHDGSIALLRDALSHERPPTPPPTPAVTASGTPGVAPAWNPLALPGADRFGRLQLRIGTAHLLAGRLEPALTAYREVVRDYPRTALAAEGQYRIGYAYETVADDFDLARAEYGKVKEQGAGGGFGEQASTRLATLERLAQFKSAGGDSAEKAAEAGFARAEVYLFQLDKPDRALQEYQRLAGELKGTPHEAKALNAQAWVLSRKLDRRAEADSLFWAVVRQHPATEAQLAARDYLEARGVDVPSDLIRMPERRLLARADTTRLTPPPSAATPLGGGALAAGDSTARMPGSTWRNAVFGTQRPGPMLADSGGYARGPRLMVPPGGPADSVMLAGDPRRPARGPGLAQAGPDSVLADSARVDSARVDSARVDSVRADSARVAPVPVPTRKPRLTTAGRDSLMRAAAARSGRPDTTARALRAPAVPPTARDSALARARASAADSAAAAVRDSVARLAPSRPAGPQPAKPDTARKKP